MSIYMVIVKMNLLSLILISLCLKDELSAAQLLREYFLIVMTEKKHTFMTSSL